MPAIEISPEEIRAALQVALEKHLTPEKKDALVRDAIADLVKSGSHFTDSELRQAFRHGAANVAREVVAAEFDRPEVRVQLGELVTSALAKVFEPGDKRDSLEERLSEAIGNALTGGRY